MAEWSWEPDDFAALWYSDANDRIPFPLHYTSRLTTNDEVAAHRAAVRARYDADETERINLALHTLTKCDLRIEIAGVSTVLGNGTPREYRVIGARTLFHAVMLTQTAADDDGPIRCRLFPTAQLPARVAAILPTVPPGDGQPETFHVNDLDAKDVGYTRNSARERFDRLTDRRLDGTGTAGLLPGYLHRRPDPWFAIAWFDATGDGRYVQQQSRDHIAVRPAGARDLSTYFGTWIDRSLQRLRVDEPDTW